MHPGWEICGEVNDGWEAVTKATELKPDHMLLDFRMPLANGIQAGSEIHDKLPTTPIVMYTLYKTRELEVAAKLVGIRQVMGKEGGRTTCAPRLKKSWPSPTHRNSSGPLYWMPYREMFQRAMQVRKFQA